MKDSKINVAVIMGGPSKDHHDISLETGKSILSNLDDQYETFKVFVDKDGNWDISHEKLKEKADIAFIALHGNYGEDGRIQDELESLGIPYTGSDSQSSGLSMNKFLSLRLLNDFGFQTPHTLDLSKKDWLDSEEKVLNKITDRISAPWVIKPNRGSASIDVYFAEDRDDLQESLFRLFKKNKDVIVQEYIEGKEVTCGVLDHGDSSTCYPLIPVEVVPNLSHFLSHDSKHKEDGAEVFVPPEVPDTLLDQIRKIAKQCHEVLDCCCVSKTDMVVTEKGQVYILEVNTHPNMTYDSIFLKGAEEMDISYKEVIDRIIKAGLKKHSHPHIL